MSTLGRKAMKKTLKRLKAEAQRMLNEYHKATEKLSSEQDDLNRAKAQGYFTGVSHVTFSSLLDYITALKDYCSELDEHWDKKEEEEMKKLLKMIREYSEQKQPIQKKRETTGTPIV